MTIEAALMAAREIEEDCLDRRGIKWGFQDLDEDIRADILKLWANIIQKHCGRQGNGLRHQRK